MPANSSAASVSASIVASSASAWAVDVSDSGSCSRHSSYSTSRSRMPSSRATNLSGREAFRLLRGGVGGCAIATANLARSRQALCLSVASALCRQSDYADSTLSK